MHGLGLGWRKKGGAERPDKNLVRYMRADVGGVFAAGISFLPLNLLTHPKSRLGRSCVERQRLRRFRYCDGILELILLLLLNRRAFGTQQLIPLPSLDGRISTDHLRGLLVEATSSSSSLPSSSSPTVIDECTGDTTQGKGGRCKGFPLDSDSGCVLTCLLGE